MDCGVRFTTEEYTSHNSCISEAQKCEGRLYKEPSKHQAKKKNLQERWMDVIKSVVADKTIHDLHSDPVTQDIVQHISQFNNVPRKKAKFFNFLTSSVPSASKATQIRIWNALERAWREDKEKQDAQAAASVPIANEDSKKRKPPASEEVQAVKKVKMKANGSVKAAAKTSRESGSEELKVKEEEKDKKAGKWEEIVWKVLRAKSETTLKKLMKRLKKKGHETDVAAVKEFLLSLEGVIELKIGDHVVRVTM